MAYEKCPYCGSTAQVRELGRRDSKEALIEEYQCGCGCRFDHYYYWCGDTIYFSDVKIIKREG